LSLSYLSVCSGIEAATVAWHPLGFRPLAFSEIEPVARAVLAHHYPDVPLHGDFTLLRDEDWIAGADILVGGTPCQGFSIAGLRRSLDDARGNLTLEFLRLADAIDERRAECNLPPCIVLWENVPGVLSVRDNAFGCFLSGLSGEDTPFVPPRGKWTNAGVALGPARAVAWRILDAQFFGLAQRRRRVFVVASAREGFDPAAVLLEFEGVRRDSPPRRETRQDAAAGTPSGPDERRSH
jgi:DNA (cytosine-5)-methyltransferase 1